MLWSGTVVYAVVSQFSYDSLCCINTLLFVEVKLHDESRLIQRCFDDNKDDDKGDDKKLKGQSKNEFKIESITLQDSRGKLKNTSRFKRKVDFKNQD